MVILGQCVGGAMEEGAVCRGALAATASSHGCKVGWVLESPFLGLGLDYSRKECINMHTKSTWSTMYL